MAEEFEKQLRAGLTGREVEAFEPLEEGFLDSRTEEEKKDLSTAWPESVAADAAAQIAYIQKDPDMEGTYFEAKNDLETTGRTKFLEYLQKQEEEIHQQAVISAIGTAKSREEIQQIATDSMHITTAASQQLLQKAFEDTMIEDATRSADGTTQRIAKGLQEEQDKKLVSRSILDQQIEGEFLTPSSEFISGLQEEALTEIAGVAREELAYVVADVSNTIVPLAYGETMRRLYEHTMGEEFSIAGTVFVGETVSEMRNHFLSLDREGQKEFASKLVQFFKEEDQFGFDQNFFNALITVPAIIDPNFVLGEDFDAQRLAENVLGVLDAVPVLNGLLKGGKHFLRTANKTPGRMASNLSAAPVRPANEAEAAVTTGEDSATALIRGHTPSSFDNDVVKGATDQVLNVLETIKKDAQGVFQRAEFSNVEKNRAIRSIVNSKGAGRLKVNSSSATSTDVDGVYSVKGVMGSTEDVGFSHVEDALAAAKRGGFDNPTILKRAENGDLVPVDIEKAGDKVGEYFYQFEKAEIKTPANLFETTKGVDLEDINTKFFGINLGKFVRYAKDASAIFNNATASKLVGKVDQFIASQVQVRNILKEFNSLKAKQRTKVLQWIAATGGENGGTANKITYENAVLGIGEEGVGGLPRLTDNEFVAVKEIEAMHELGWSVKNRKLVDWLKNNDYRAIHSIDHSPWFGKDVKAEELDVVGSKVDAVIDAVNGKKVALTAEDLADVRRGDARLMKLRGSEFYDGDSLSYVLVRREEFSQITDIPPQALPKIQGYVARDYDDDVFITMIDTRRMHNGKKVAEADQRPQVINTATSFEEAKKGIEALKRSLSDEDKPFIKYKPRYGREIIDTTDLGAKEYDFAKAHGLLHQGKRGNVVNRIGPESPATMSVLNSINRSMNKIATDVSMTQFLDDLEDLFVREYGDLLQVRKGEGPSFPTNVGGFKAADDPESVQRLKRAKGAWEYIKFLGEQQDPLTSGWQKFLLKQAIKLEGKGKFGKLTKNSFSTIGHITGLGKRDPLDVLRGAAFTTMIALNPLRQLPLQMTQHSMFAAMLPTYFARGLYRDTSTLLTGAAIRHTPEWGKSVEDLAKKRGLSVKEYTQEIDDWMNSGLPQSVDSHILMAGSTLEATDVTGLSKTHATLSRVGSIFKAPIRGANKVGFQAGEQVNLATSWNIARELLKKDGILKPSAEQIANKARQLSLGMNRAGEFKYQRGFLKLATQFWSFQHKALLSWLPQKFIIDIGGSRAFTGAEKAKIAVPQLMLWGSAGLGLDGIVLPILDRAFQDGLDKPVPQPVREAVRAGLGQYAINQALQAITEDDTSLEFSALGPLSGSTFGVRGIFDFLWNTDAPTITKLMGASGFATDRFLTSAGRIMDLMGKGTPETVPDRIEAAMKWAARGMSSGASNYWKVHYLNQAYWYQDKRGFRVAELTGTEAWAQRFFGLQPTDIQRYYEINNDVRLYREELEKEADRLSSTIVDIIKSRGADMTPDQLFEELTDHSLPLYLADVGDDTARGENLRQLTIKKIIDKVGGDSKAERLLMSVINVNADPTTTKGLLRRMDLPKEDLEILEGFIDDVTAEPEGSQLPQDNR